MHTTDAQAPETEAPLDPATASRNRLVIGLLLLSAFVVILNETIMGVALPRLMKDLSITASAAQWLTTAFLLTMAVVIPVTGFLLQRFHTRPIFIAAMAMFSLGTLVSALAPGLEVLILGRVGQAVGTAIMMPLLMTTVMNLVPPSSRGRTMGNISTVISVAPAIGPTLSGLILSVLTWRWMFILVLPIALGALALGASRISNVTEPRPTPIDWLSVPLSLVGFGGVVYGLSELGTGSATAWTAFGVGAVGLAVFVARQFALQRDDKALLDLRTFASPTFSVSVVLMAICMMALLGTIVLLPIYTQNVLGMSTLHTGLLLLPGGLVMGLMSPVVGRFYDRRGPRLLVVPGTLLTSGVLWGMTLLDEHTTLPWLLLAHVSLSVGLALTFTPLFSAALGALPRQFYGHGSAMIGTVQQVAGAAGTALFVALMTQRVTAMLAMDATPVVATAAGIRAAFFWGAVISVFAIIAAWFVRRAPEAT